MVKILKASAGWDSLTKDQKLGLRNYFVQQAALSSNANTIVPALKGIELTGIEVPAIRLVSKNTLSISDKTKNAKFEIVDAFGKAFKGVKNVKASLLDLSDNKAAVKDITSQVKLDNSALSWSIPADLSIGRYQPLFHIDGYTVKGQVVTVTDQVKFSALHYAVL